MKNPIITITFLVLFLSQSAAQTMSFKDVYEGILVNDPFSNMLNLRKYQQINPEHAISYFLLGTIYDKYMRETDPTRQFIMLESHYNQVKTYYSLLQAKLTEHQASQDREYYGEIENISGKRKIGYPDIIHDARKKADEASLYFENAKTVYESYVNCINKYNQCLFAFREIVSIYPYYKDLYLLAPPAVIEKINELGKNYRESIRNFEIYYNACKELPKLIKAPHLIELPIITYRLEGVVETDFTSDTVRIWNYGKWANEFNEMMGSDIKTIREQLLVVDNKLDLQSRELITQNQYFDEPMVFKPEERFQFLIGKYDPQSLCNRLIDYKISKNDFLARSRLSINNPEKAGENFINNRLRYYKDLALNLGQVNNEVAKLKQSVTLSDIDRYFDFFESRYKGMDGLKRWCDVEQYQNREFFNKIIKNLDHFLRFEKKKSEFSGLCAFQKEVTVPLGVQIIDDVPVLSDTIVSLFFESTGPNWHYISGLAFGCDSLCSPFLANSDSANQIRWLIYPSLGKIEPQKQLCWPSGMKVNSDSSVILLLTVLEKSEICPPKNYLIKLDKSGKPNFSALIDSCGYPRYFSYDEIADDYLLITKGNNRSNKNDKPELASISLYGGDPLKNSWKFQFDLTGSITGVLTTNSNFLIVGNDFEPSSDENSKKQYSGFSTHIERSGKVGKTHRYSGPEGIWLSEALKATSQLMLLFGHTCNDQQENNQPVFLLVDEFGAMEFRNLDDIKTVAVPYKAVVPEAP
jgi:hypothetical protein